MRTTALLLGLVCTSACGGAAPETSTAPAPAASEEPSGRTPEEAVQRCHDQGGPNRNDYAFVASYRCPDGSVPLGLDPMRGAAARVGNVGAGPDGHVLDLYEVPCPSGPVRVYVDAYHCADRDVDVDPDDLSPEQLASVAQQGRDLEGFAFDPRATQLRESMFAWAQQSPQVQLRGCRAVVEAVVHADYEHARLLLTQLVVSMTAATILAPEQASADAVTVEVAGVEGALRLHDAIVRERGADAADPALTELLRLRDEGGLARRVRELSGQCGAPTTGLVMSTDEGNVWPPSGAECERLVRCCESRGLVRDGAAVTGTPGLACLLSATPPDVDCAGGLGMLEEQGVQCD